MPFWRRQRFPPSLQTVTVSWKDVEADRVLKLRCESDTWRWTVCSQNLWGLRCGQIRPEANILNARHTKLQVSDFKRKATTVLAKGVERNDNGSSYGSRELSFETMDIWTSWSDQRVDSNCRIAMAPEAHKWLLKPLRLSHGIPATLQHLMHNWSIIPILMNSYTLNQFYGRVNENCRTRTHSWSSTNIGAHEAVCGFSTEARVNSHLPHSYGPQNSHVGSWYQLIRLRAE